MIKRTMIGMIALAGVMFAFPQESHAGSYKEYETLQVWHGHLLYIVSYMELRTKHVQQPHTWGYLVIREQDFTYKNIEVLGKFPKAWNSFYKEMYNFGWMKFDGLSETAARAFLTSCQNSVGSKNTLTLFHNVTVEKNGGDWISGYITKHTEHMAYRLD